MINMVRLHLFLVFMFLAVSVDVSVGNQDWPVPYQRYESRPKFDPYCQATFQMFCPTGEVPNTMPKFHPEDHVEVYALKAPVFESKLGNLLGKFHIMHDAMAFNNLNIGRNFTLEWYELVEVFNCTFAHVLDNGTLLWCNQGAACIYDGVDDKHWTENGTLVKIADITGAMYNDFAKWVLWDNATAIYYETWTVEEEPGGKMWFDSFDCASFILRAFDELGKLGAKFNQSVQLNYTRVHLYTEEPQYLGNASEVFANETLGDEIRDFYKKFQSHQSPYNLLEHLVEAYIEIVDQKKYYFFYNFEYWFLPMKSPFVKLSYNVVPLPNNTDDTTLRFEKKDEY